MSLTILPDINEPMDERSVCSTYAELILASTWTNTAGSNIAYLGMTTAVTNDPDENKNGLYILTALPVTADSWEKAGTGTGTQGEDGKSGVYVGETEPDVSEEANVWINPKGTAAFAAMSYYGDMAPSDSLGDEGDIYALVTGGTCELYFKTDVAWVKAV